MKISWFVVSSVLMAWAQGTAFAAEAASPETNSIRYQWLDSDSPQRETFVSQQNDLVNQRLARSPNLSAIQKYFTTLYNQGTTFAQTYLDATHSLRLVDRGLGQPTDLVLNDGTQDQVLFSSFTLKKSIDDAVLAAGISPDKKTVYLMISQDGSIDQMTAILYDLANKKLLDSSLSLAENEIAWLSANTLIFDQLSPDGKSSLAKYDLDTDQTHSLGVAAHLDSRFGYVLYFSDNHFQLHNQGDQTEIQVDPSVWPQSIVASDSEHGAVYVLCKGSHQMGEIRKFVHAPAATEGEVVVSEGSRTLVSATMIGADIMATYRNGPDRFLEVYDFCGRNLGEIAIPNCCSVLGFTGQSGFKIQMDLVSAVTPRTSFNYDLQKKSWNQDPDALMLQAGGIQYVTEIKYAQSDDGTQIPVRLTRRADLIQDHSNAVVFSSYGGFDLPGYLDPVFDAPSAEFLNRGGILGGPGLRGGNEYGSAWWKAAIMKGKIKTYQDLNAAAKMLVSEGWTVPQKISSTGTSNGGLTVAATALLYPGSFGLVIPVAGVNDLLGKDKLDANDMGWSYEYGNDSDPSAVPYLTAESPLENAAHQGASHFLIIDGLDDTRVNAANSFKLAAALEDQGGYPESVSLLSIKDAGHWVQGFIYGNEMTWQANVAIWTSIFDQSGMKW